MPRRRHLHTAHHSLNTLLSHKTCRTRGSKSVGASARQLALVNAPADCTRSVPVICLLRVLACCLTTWGVVWALRPAFGYVGHDVHMAPSPGLLCCRCCWGGSAPPNPPKSRCAQTRGIRAMACIRVCWTRACLMTCPLQQAFPLQPLLGGLRPPKPPHITMSVNPRCYARSMAFPMPDTCMCTAWASHQASLWDYARFHVKYVHPGPHITYAICMLQALMEWGSAHNTLSAVRKVP